MQSIRSDRPLFFILLSGDDTSANASEWRSVFKEDRVAARFDLGTFEE